MSRLLQRMRRKGMGDERGGVAVYTAIALIAFLGVSALAVDVGHLYGVRNELNNAADAAALAGALLLFDDKGILHADSATDEAKRVVQLNSTGDQKVKDYTVEVGHWSFTKPGFDVPDDPTQQLDKWQAKSFEELDLETRFINAVRVTAKRPDAPSFFARILGFDKFFVSASGVAFIGFAGTLYPQDVDEPIAVCEDSIKVSDSGGLFCNVGRMIPATTDTARWSDLKQPSVCIGSVTASAKEIKTAINKAGNCDGGNLTPIVFGGGLETNKGETSALPDLISCWETTSYDKKSKTWEPWEIVLPVISCDTTSNCAPLVGAVRVKIVWINNSVHDNKGVKTYSDAPTQMGDWSSSNTDGAVRWDSFAKHFKLTNDGTENGTAFPYEDKSIYFQTECEKLTPRGESGGKNYGILAKYPKLVQ